MDRLLRSTTPIKYPGYNHYDGHSTGFFFRTNHSLYLITSRHCLFQSRYEDDGSFEPDKISIRIRNQGSHRETHSKRISLYDADGNREWIEPYHHQVDIAALPLDLSLRGTGNTFLGGGLMEVAYEPQNIVRPGELAIVAGYPILNRETYAPILRNAMISSALDVDFDKQPYFLVDSQLHDGTSGSPVLVREEDDLDRTRFTLIGVHSGQYDLTAEGSENLNRVWFLRPLRDRLIDIEPGLLEMW